MSSLSETYERHEFDEVAPYRALSKTAILSLIMGLLGMFVILFPTLLVLCVAACVFGLIARTSFRRYPEELTGRWPARIGLALGAVFFVAGTAFHVFVYATEVPDGYQRISFYDLQPDKSETQNKLSDRAIALNNQKVFVKGYCHPGVKGQKNIRRFVLVGDMRACCFGGQPKLTDMIEVFLEPPHSIRYSTRKIRLGGEFVISGQSRQVAGNLEGGLYNLKADYLK